MARKKAAQSSSVKSAVAEPEEPKKNPEEPKENQKAAASVTFILNRSAKETTIVMSSAKTRYTEQGAISDPDNPPRRIRIKNGMYVTSDPEEIEFLKSHSNFNAKDPDGFSIMKKLSPVEEVKGIMERTGLSRDQILQAIGEA